MVVGAALSLAVRRTLEPVEGIHRVVSGRWFTRLGPVARPVEWWHDAISGLVYGSIRSGAVLAGHTVDALRQEESTVDTGVRAIVSGLWGDDLGSDEPRLAQPMILTRPRAPAGDGRARAAVLVHGLMQSEQCWNGSDERPGLVDVLRHRTDVDPITVRFNTGRSVGDNGKRLAELLETRLDGMAVESVDLIGHSMGGLVARAAVEQGLGRGHAWVGRLRHVITLGTPHGGAPMEKAVHAVSRAMEISAASRPLADFLNRRSAGIKDLRHGTVTPPISDCATPPSSTGRATERFVAGVITADPRHPVGQLAGDLLVRRHSAEGGGLAPTETMLVPGTTHAGLLDHPEVVDRVIHWMTS